MNAPEYGDLVWVDFSPHAGHEQAKRRPGLVLSGKRFNALFGVAIVCPISTKTKQTAFAVSLPETHDVRGWALVQHVRSIDWRARRAEYIGRAPNEVILRAVDILKDIISIDHL